MANSDNEQEVKLLMNQWKKPVLIPKEEPSNENPTASSTGDILSFIDDDNNEEEHGPKILDFLSQ